MHALEMAKTAWNAFVSRENTSNALDVSQSRAEIKRYLDLGSRIFNVYGPEGDPDGPLSSVHKLQALVDDL